MIKDYYNRLERVTKETGGILRFLGLAGQI